MAKKTRSLFGSQRGSQRLNTPSVRKRVDAGIVIAGLIVALVFGVLTWFNFQDRKTPGTSPITESNQTTSLLRQNGGNHGVIRER